MKSRGYSHRGVGWRYSDPMTHSDREWFVRFLSEQAKQIARMADLVDQESCLFSSQFARFVDWSLIHVADELSKSEALSPEELIAIESLLRRFSNRLCDYVDGESDAFLRTFAVRDRSSRYRDGQNLKGLALGPEGRGDTVEETNRFWVLAASRLLIRRRIVEGDGYSIAADKIGISPAALKAWLWRRRKCPGRPDLPPLRVRSFVLSTVPLHYFARSRDDAWVRRVTDKIFDGYTRGDAYQKYFPAEETRPPGII